MERQDKPHVGVQLDPTYIILGEIQNVVAAMRLNSKWSSRSRSVRVPAAVFIFPAASTLATVDIKCVKACKTLQPFFTESYFGI
jgi:hypothetical protein